MRNKKLLLITPTFPPEIGGIQNVLYNTAKNSANTVVVLCPPHKEAKEFDKRQHFKIKRIKPFNHLFDAIPILYIPYLLFCNRKYDIVCFGHVSWSYIGYLIKKLFGTKYIVFTYGGEVKIVETGFARRLYKYAVELGLKNADIVLTISNWTRRELLAIGIPDNKIKILHPGVNFAVFEKSKDPARLEKIIEAYNLKNKKILLTVSRIFDRKGHAMVIKALPKILEKEPHTTYVVVGGPKHRQEQMERLAEKYNVRDSVVFAGVKPVNELIDYFHLCDIFIMASRHRKEEGIEDTEGFGIVFLEANACGKPVIGGNVGGIPDAIKNGKTGFLVDPESADDIVEKCLKLLGDKELREKLGNCGKEWAKEHEWSTLIKKFDELLGENL